MSINKVFNFNAKRIIPLILGIGIVLLSAFTETDPEPETKVELGKKLFFDPILSKDKTISCGSCHMEQFAFADTLIFSDGVSGHKTLRNTPSLTNMKSRPYFFYDGRAATLEEQVFHPVRNPLEMDLSPSLAIKRIKEDKNYSSWFKKIYKHKPDSASIVNAIALFMESLESPGDSPVDQYVNAINPNALTESQIRGRFLFINGAKCFDCHFSPDFTGDEFRNIGTYDGKNLNDVGRFAITKDSSDLGKFKVPGLRNVAVTPPYMHNGMFKTLEEVVEFYDNPYKFVEKPINIDTLLLKPLFLSVQDKKDLVAFMKGLTDQKYISKVK
jgi:cytochrome c peroxidase